MIWMLAGGLFAIFIFLKRLFPKSAPNERFIRGERLRKRPLQNRDKNAIYQWGKCRITFEEARKHFCVVGSTGSGKTLTVLLLLKSVLRQMGRGTSARALIYDCKTDLLPAIRGSGVEEDAILILNPLDERARAWRIADDITTASQADDMAACLLPANRSESNPYFADTARRLLSGIIESFIFNSPGDWTLRDVILAAKTERRLAAVLHSSPGTADLLEHFQPHSTFRNVKSLLDGNLRGYAPIATAWQTAEKKGRTFSISEWLTGNSVLVLGNNTKSKEAISRLNAVIFSEVTKQILARPGKVNSETWLFLDEFRELGKLPLITDLMITGRSKGAAVVLGFQCIAGLDSVYGRELSREILGCAQNLAVLHINSSQPDTRKWASDVLGEHLIRRKESSQSDSKGKSGYSHSDSSSYRTSSEKIWLPSQFASDLPPASLSHGLTGIFRSGSVFSKTHISGRKLFSKSGSPLSLPPACDFAEIESPTGNSQITLLEDWTESDRRRLGIRIESGAATPEINKSIHPLFSNLV